MMKRGDGDAARTHLPPLSREEFAFLIGCLAVVAVSVLADVYLFLRAFVW